MRSLPRRLALTRFDLSVQGSHSPGKPGGILRVVVEKSGKMCSCVWLFTASIVVDTKYARKELFTTE